MFRISVIFGTRPEAIKLAPVVDALERCPEVSCHVCVTGQHREMLTQILEGFDIQPDVNLDIMVPEQTLAELTSRAVASIDSYLRSYRPHLVVVQGDTTSALCAALSAFYNQIPVAHVEAGLRTSTIREPWPEEANRRLISQIADLHFAPTERARENLLGNGVDAESIRVTGNTVVDALVGMLNRVRQSPPPIIGMTEERLGFWAERPMVLITAHRRENFGEPMKRICHAILELAREFPEALFVYPVHLNPNARNLVKGLLTGEVVPANIVLLEPQPYLSFVRLMDRATVILTDSGGIQEEAPTLGKPVLLMRDTTERPEAVNEGTVSLVGTSYDKIVGEVAKLLAECPSSINIGRRHNPYGDGEASARIREACLELLNR